MPVYKNEINNSWYIKTYIKDRNGISKQITKRNKAWVGRNGKILAQQEEIRLKNSIDDIPYEDKIITIKELCEYYLKSINGNVRISTYDRNKNIIYTHIVPHLGNIEANKLQNIEILKWHKKLDDYVSIKNKKLSLAYKQKIHSTLSTVFNYGCMFHHLSKNVPHIVGNFKQPRGTRKKEMTIMTLDEFNQFIKCEKNRTYELFYKLLFFTGLRRGELLSLCWENIDIDNRLIKVKSTKSIRKNSKIEAPKTDESVRDIKMINCVYQLLLSIKKEKGFLFEDGSITGTTLDRKCKSNCKKIGFTQNMRIHDFRHSFASLCIDNDVPVAVLSKYLGHANISTTLDVYGHLYPDSQKKLTDKLDFI